MPCGPLPEDICSTRHAIFCPYLHGLPAVASDASMPCTRCVEGAKWSKLRVGRTCDTGPGSCAWTSVSWTLWCDVLGQRPKILSCVRMHP